MSWYIKGRCRLMFKHGNGCLGGAKRVSSVSEKKYGCDCSKVESVKIIHGHHFKKTSNLTSFFLNSFGA